MPTNAASVSVITVTYNNASGLAQTLESLSKLVVRPFEVLIIDGKSSDDTAAVVRRWQSSLPITFVTEPDGGIYDAMNKGQALAQGQLLHYLNAGDVVWGEPYAGIVGPCLLRTQICESNGDHVFEDFVKLAGFGYCHQGILFPRAHEPYDTRLRIAADLDAIAAAFPRGLRSMPWAPAGGVRFFLGGVSSARRRHRDREVRQVLRRRLPFLRARALIAAIALKACVPSGVRKRLAHAISAGVDSAAVERSNDRPQ